MVAESSCIRFFVDNGPVSSLQSGLDLPGHIREHVPWVNANPRDGIPIMPATNQVLFPQNTVKEGYIYENSNHRSKRTDWSIHSR